MTNPKQEFPSFEEKLPEINQFLLHLKAEFNTGKIQSWGDMDEKVKVFFNTKQMNKTNATIPGWKEMASYSNGVTLTHVMCALLGLFMMPEFHALTWTQQNITQWIVLLHDIGKITIRGRGDYFHPYRSAIIAGQTLPMLGFSTTNTFGTNIDRWIEFVNSARYESKERPGEYMPDNAQVGKIFTGIDELYGKDSPAAFIIKGIVLHQSIDTVKDWPQTAPLTEEQVRQFVDKDLLPLLRVMHLSDCEGWSMFHPEIRMTQRKETLEAFRQIEIKLFTKEKAGV